jgi:hypothetical protein
VREKNKGQEQADFLVFLLEVKTAPSLINMEGESDTLVPKAKAGSPATKFAFRSHSMMVQPECDVESGKEKVVW